MSTAGYRFQGIDLPQRFQRPSRTLCGIVVFVAFTGLVTIRGPASPGAMGALLATIGGALWARDWRLARGDLGMAAVFLILPLYYVLNMAWSGWDWTQLDKPSRLVWGFFVYLAISRVGVGAWSLRWGVLAGSIAAGGLAAYQAYELGYERTHGVMNAIPFGNFSLLLATLAVAGWIVLPRVERNLVLTASTAIAAACGLYASFASGTRGGWVMIPALAWIIGIGVGRRPSHKHRILASAVLVLLVVGAGLAFALNERTLAEMTAVRQFLTASSGEAVSMPLSSIGARFHLYRVGFDAFLSNPLTGIGFAQLPAYLATGAGVGTINPLVVNYTHLHSSIVDTLARGGLLGLLAFTGFGLGFIRYFYRALVSSADRDSRYFALAGLLCIAAALLFSLTNVLFPAIVGTNALVMTLAVPAGALAHLRRRQTSDECPTALRSPT